MNFRAISRAATAVLNRIRILQDPVKFARDQGVVMGSDIHLYAARPGMFGTEPWLVKLGSNVHITAGCQFITHDGGVLILRKDDPSLEITLPITVGDNVYLGINAIILPGVNIGDNVIIGAGSVVTKNIPENSVAAGVPAKIIKSLAAYHEDAKKKSIGLGHLSASEKALALKKLFHNLEDSK